MSSPATLEFWFDPASTYAYLSAMRIEAEAASRGVTVAWRPFLLGPIFQAQGWTTSPFNLYPAKGRYMVRDIERIAAARGLPPFRLPEPFPAASLLAARVAIVAAAADRAGPFARALFTAQFAEARDIADRGVLADCLAAAGASDPGPVFEAAEAPANKERLRDQTARAERLGIFGAPGFVTPAGELFWGDDRLEAALDWMVVEAEKS